MKEKSTKSKQKLARCYLNKCQGEKTKKLFDIADLFNPNAYQFWFLLVGIIAVVIGVIYRPFSSYFKFIYPNAKYQTIGNPFLTKKELDKMLDCKNLKSFLENLNYFKDYHIKGENARDIQFSLDENLLETVEMMRKDSNKSIHSFFDAYLEKYDMQTIRDEIKKTLDRILEGETFEEEEEPKIIFERNRRLIAQLREAENMENLEKILLEYGFDEKMVKEVTSAEKVDFLAVDIMIDKYIIDCFNKIKLPYKCDKPVEAYLKTLVDISNIKNMLRAKHLGYNVDRCKKMFLDGGREVAKWLFEEIAEVDQVPQVISSLEGTTYFKWLRDAIEDYNREDSVQPLENALERCLLKQVKDVSVKYYLTLGPLLQFLVNKEYEIRNLKIIAKGVEENIDPQTIRKYLLVLEDKGV